MKQLKISNKPYLDSTISQCFVKVALRSAQRVSKIKFDQSLIKIKDLEKIKRLHVIITAGTCQLKTNDSIQIKDIAVEN